MPSRAHATALRAASLVLFSSVVACGSSHRPGDDAGGSADAPSGVRDTGPLPDGAVILPDGAVILPDAPDELDGGVRRDAPIPDVGPVARIGTPCESDADCPGLFCSTATVGFGYCSWVCTDSMPCPDDAYCARFDPMASYGYCMPRCDPGTDTCPMGTRCQAGVLPEPVCYPGCVDDADCGAGRRCGFGVSGLRQCYTPSAMVGQECTLTTDCPESGYCLDEDTWGSPGGMCASFCDLATGSGCLPETTCVPWGFMSGAGACLPTCDMTTPCRVGYECRATGTAGVSACVPHCRSDADCSGGRTCSFVTGTCG